MINHQCPSEESQGYPAGFARVQRLAGRILEMHVDQLPDTPEMMQTMLSWFDLEILRVYCYVDADMPFLEVVAKHLPDTKVPRFSDAQSHIPAGAYAQLADPSIAEAEVRPDGQALQPSMAERYWIGDAESDLEAVDVTPDAQPADTQQHIDMMRTKGKGQGVPYAAVAEIRRCMQTMAVAVLEAEELGSLEAISGLTAWFDDAWRLATGQVKRGIQIPPYESYLDSKEGDRLAGG